MAGPNSDVVRRALDAFNRRDVDEWTECCHPEIESVPPLDWPEYEPTRGPEAVWDFYVSNNEPWGDGLLEHAEVVEAGDRAVAHVRGSLRGQASGASVEWSFWQVVTVRDGRALRVEWFTDRAEALSAAGIGD